MSMLLEESDMLQQKIKELYEIAKKIREERV